MTTIRSSRPSCVWVSPTRINGRIDAAYFHCEYLPLDECLAHFPKREVKTLDSLLANPRRVLFQQTTSYARNEAPEDAVPFISGVDIDGSTMSINWSSVRFVDRWMLEKYPKGQLRDGTLLIKVKGPHQHTAFVTKADRTALVSGTVFFGGVRDCSPYYLAAYLSSGAGTAWRSRLRTNTTVEFIGNEELRAVPVLVPDRCIQDYIGAKVELAERCRAAAATIEEELAKKLRSLYEGCPSLDAAGRGTLVDLRELDSDRIDAWHYQRHYIDLVAWLRENTDFVQISTLGTLSSDRWTPAEHTSDRFRYIEIADIDTATGHLGFSEISVAQAPSRARRRVSRGDVLVSTVRPNRGAVAVVPDALHEAVATTGFAVVRAKKEEDSFFLGLVLRTPVSIAQLMRWNTGSTYPAIEEDVVLRTWIPGAKIDVRMALGRSERQRRQLLRRAVELVTEAKADVEALIGGTLDTSAIVAGKLKPPAEREVLGA